MKLTESTGGVRVFPAAGEVAQPLGVPRIQAVSLLEVETKERRTGHGLHVAKGELGSGLDI